MIKQIFITVLVTLSFLFGANNLQAQCQPNAGVNDSTSCWLYYLHGVLSNPNSTCEWTCINDTVSFDYPTSSSTSLLFSGFGTYKFVLTETNDSCVSSDTVVIVYYQFFPDPGNDTTICDTVYQMDADPTYPGYWSYYDPRVYISDNYDPNAIIGYNPDTTTWSSDGTFSTVFTWHSNDNSNCQCYSASVTITFSQCLNNIKTLNKSNITRIYPNPAHNNIQIEIEGSQYADKFEILNIDGKLVKQVSIDENIINISDLENRVYIIKIGNSIQKFIKE